MCAAQQLHPQPARIAQDAEHGLLNHSLAVDDGDCRIQPADEEAREKKQRRCG